MSSISKSAYIAILEKLLDSYEHLIKLIPECPLHGDTCIPHATEWISEKANRDKAKVIRETFGKGEFSYENCQNGYIIYGPDKKQVDPWELVEILNGEE
jgi:hypothetical protein